MLNNLPILDSTGQLVLPMLSETCSEMTKTQGGALDAPKCLLLIDRHISYTDGITDTTYVGTEFKTQ